MNILILAAGSSCFSSHDGGYPLCLAELDGIPLVERLVNACNPLGSNRFIFALREEDVRHYHLDKVVSLLVPRAATLRISDKVRGAACTALHAAGLIDNDEELLILNGDSLLDVDYSMVIEDFRARDLTAGTITFSSVHPRYAYVRLDDAGMVVEAAEKKTISRHATAGFYWFSRGSDFIRAVQNMIRKDAHVNDLFFICPSFNELILEQGRIGVYPIDAGRYRQLKTKRQLQQYDSALE